MSIIKIEYGSSYILVLFIATFYFIQIYFYFLSSNLTLSLAYFVYDNKGCKNGCVYRGSI